MSKKFIRAIFIPLLCMGMLLASQTTAFAQAEEPKEESTAATVEQVSSDVNSKTENDKEGGILTPQGNLSLQDDITEEENQSIQFITVTTKQNHTFYLVIEHKKNGQNVHFLNQVDEADLMNLMTEEEKKAYEESIKKAELNTQEEMPNTEPKEETPKEKEVKKETSKNSVNPMILLFVFVGIGGLIAGAYYVVKIKGKKNQPSIDEELEFFDDEEYLNEDEEDMPEEAYGSENEEEDNEEKED